MAIPDNYIDKITKGNDSRMISPAADMVRVNNDNFDGETLDEVLDDVAQAIGEAGEVKSVTINGTNHTPDSSGVIDLGTVITAHQDISGKANTADVANTYATKSELGGKLSQSDVSVETQGDGMVDLKVKDDTYTINLNHTHENMAKLIVCEESDLPSTLDNSTIYAQVDDAETPTEIQSLWIAGLEFVGGGGGEPDYTPKLTSPRNGATIDFDGQSTTTLVVKGRNLTSNLSLVVTGDFTVTANGQSVSTIAAADVTDGASLTLTLTKGNDFISSGSLELSSADLDEDVEVRIIDSSAVVQLTGVKFTGTQWLKTPYKPNAATTVTMICRFEENEHTIIDDKTNHGYFFMSCVQNSSSEKFLFYAFKPSARNYQLIANVPTTPVKVISILTGFLTDRSEFKVSPQLMSFTPNGGTANTVAIGVTPTMLSELEIGRGITDNYGTQIFNYYDLTIYELTISEGSTTVHHYLPKSLNGIPGLYDTVTDTFISSETAKTSGLTSDELVAIP